MISGKIKRVVFFTACHECKLKGTKSCQHPFFEKYFTQRKTKDVGCSEGQVVPELLEETENKREIFYV